MKRTKEYRMMIFYVLVIGSVNLCSSVASSNIHNLRLNTTISFPNVMVTCTIDKISPSISNFLMCPHDQYCFRNCQRYCKNCKIKCSLFKFGKDPTGQRSYTYTFRGTDKNNWGNWGCNYGKNKVVTNIKLQDKKLPKPNLYNKRHIKVEKVSKKNITDHNKNRNSAEKEQIITSRSSINIGPNKSSTNITRFNGQNAKSIVKAEYVILMLIVLTVSLIINIWLVVREIMTNVSRKATMSEKSDLSTCFRCVSRCFCVQNSSLDSLRNSVPSKETVMGSSAILHQHLMSRQSSHHNTYDYSPYLASNGGGGGVSAAAGIQTARLWTSQQLMQPNVYSATPNMDNPGFMNSPIVSYHLMPNQAVDNSAFTRSMSFPVRQDLPDGDIIRASSNHLIYDDVPEPSINGPIEHAVLSNHFGTLATTTSPGDKLPVYRIPARFAQVNGLIPQSHANYLRSIQRQNSLQPRRVGASSLHSQSMVNLENGLEIDPSISTSEAVIKDAISSRVELSKEMISQADNLLRKADMILSSHAPKPYEDSRQNSVHNSSNNETSPSNSVINS